MMKSQLVQHAKGLSLLRRPVGQLQRDMVLKLLERQPLTFQPVQLLKLLAGHMMALQRHIQWKRIAPALVD